MRKLGIPWLVALALLVGGGMASAAVVGVYAGFPIVKVEVNGRPVESDVPGIVVDGRTLLPLRAIAEALGLTVDWDGETRTASVRGGAGPAETGAAGAETPAWLKAENAPLRLRVGEIKASPIAGAAGSVTVTVDAQLQNDSDEPAPLGVRSATLVPRAVEPLEEPSPEAVCPPGWLVFFRPDGTFECVAPWDLPDPLLDLEGAASTPTGGGTSAPDDQVLMWQRSEVTLRDGGRLPDTLAPRETVDVRMSFRLTTGEFSLPTRLLVLVEGFSPLQVEPPNPCGYLGTDNGLVYWCRGEPYPPGVLD